MVFLLNPIQNLQDELDCDPDLVTSVSVGRHSRSNGSKSPVQSGLLDLLLNTCCLLKLSITAITSIQHQRGLWVILS